MTNIWQVLIIHKALPSTLYVLIHGILIATQYDISSYHYHPHLIDEKTEAWEN